MATVAAQDERIRDQVRFVNFFAGYYDAFDFVKAIGSRSRFGADYIQPWEPDKLTEEVFTLLMIESISLPSEREALDGHFTGGRPLNDSEVRSLSSEARAVHGLLSGTTLAEADALLREVPQRLLDAMDALSPSQHLDGLSARLLIMPDREDALAPVEESRRLADAMADRGDVRYTEFSFFSHVDPGEGVGPIGLLTESFKLYLHLYTVVRAAG